MSEEAMVAGGLGLGRRGTGLLVNYEVLFWVAGLQKGNSELSAIHQKNHAQFIFSNVPLLG